MYRPNNREPIKVDDIVVKKEIIEKFRKFIEEVSDEVSRPNILQLINYLNELIKVRQVIPPVSEIVTIISNKKPQLFYATKSQINTSSHLFIVFRIASGNLEYVEKSLAEYIK